MTNSKTQFPRRVTLLVLAAMAALAGNDANAQQFWVYTRVSRPIVEADKPVDEVVARSLTLFHAGRVYDWIPTVGEVTVFEPAHKRFVILSSKNMIATRVSFDEIERLISSARDETSNYVDRLLERGGNDAKTLVEPLEFQLAPAFKESFSTESQELKLMSPRFAYVVDCREPEVPEGLDAYLTYADWAARLNYVLHPQSFNPEPRLQLNESLRKIKRIPSKVQLRVEFDKPLRLQAEHQFGWKLRSTDRERIGHWETLFKGDKLEWVTFRDYQKAMLTNTAQAKN